MQVPCLCKPSLITESCSFTLDNLVLLFCFPTRTGLKFVFRSLCYNVLLTPTSCSMTNESFPTLVLKAHVGLTV